LLVHGIFARVDSIPARVTVLINVVTMEGGRRRMMIISKLLCTCNAGRMQKYLQCKTSKNNLHIFKFLPYKITTR
jgi:hypothetical protein